MALRVTRSTESRVRIHHRASVRLDAVSATVSSRGKLLLPTRAQFWSTTTLTSAAHCPYRVWPLFYLWDIVDLTLSLSLSRSLFLSAKELVQPSAPHNTS